jgi:hypothetical protein
MDRRHLLGSLAGAAALPPLGDGQTAPAPAKDAASSAARPSHLAHCQRSGYEIPGIRGAEHLDDGVLDTTKAQVAAAGGWYDAGDLRKWLFLTQPNLSTPASATATPRRSRRT